MRIRDWSSDVCSSDLPGFSTAARVTSISGRGVGMDIVKSNIEKIGGVVELRNEEGRGLTIILRVPMTLTIISGLIVRAAGQYFAIPKRAVREILLDSCARSVARRFGKACVLCVMLVVRRIITENT